MKSYEQRQHDLLIEAVTSTLTEEHMCWGHECGQSVADHVAQTGPGLQAHLRDMNQHNSFGSRSAADHAALHQLGGRGGNIAHEVTKPFSVLAHTGTSSPTNVWYGASQAYRHDTAPVMAQKGDQVHHLVGGSFLVKKNGQTHQLESAKPMSMGHPFGTGSGQKIPQDHVKTIPFVSHGKYR